MRAFVLLCTAVVAVATAAVSARANTCQLKLISSLTMTESGDHFLVPVSIVGSSRQLILELDDAFSGVTAQTALQLSLKTRPTPARIRVIIMGENASNLVRIPDLKLDRITAHDLEIPEIPTMTEADGTLALDILAANDLELDLAHDKLNVFSRDHCKGGVIYWNAPGGVVSVPFKTQKSGNLLADMNLDGRTIHVALATTSRSVMGMNVAHRIFGLDEHSPGMRLIETAPDGSTVYRYPFSAISIEGLRITNPDIVISGKASDPECDAKEHPDPQRSDQVRWCFGGGELFLGSSVLRRLHLFFAFGEKMLYVTAASS